MSSMVTDVLDHFVDKIYRVFGRCPMAASLHSNYCNILIEFLRLLLANTQQALSNPNKAQAGTLHFPLSLKNL